MRRPSRAKPDFPCKTGLSNYSREKFLGPHTDLNTGFFSQDRNDGNVPTHVGEGGRFTSEFGERGSWVAASRSHRRGLDGRPRESRIFRTTALGSRPPENAMPTFWPAGTF